MNMPIRVDISEKYFKNLCLELLGEELLQIINTDSYVRQPCYSSRARNYYYLILNRSTTENLNKIKYIQGEFPEFFINYLTEKELNTYPAHGKWQFIFSPNIYNKNNKFPLLETTNQEHVLAIRQAIFGIAHIARLYYLRGLDEKTHTWAVRQLGWALRYAENGVLKLWNYLQTGTYDNSFVASEMIEEIPWLISINEDWPKFEKAFLCDVDEYRAASLKLNTFVEFFAEKLAKKINTQHYIKDSFDEYEPKLYSFISSFKEELINEFGEELHVFYLHGSAARGDQHQNSDIDSIVVFSVVNDTILKRLKRILNKYENISVSTLSFNDLIVYPPFKYYALCLGSKKMYGKISFNIAHADEGIMDGILNNLFTVLQVSRAYLLAENYGPRAPYMLKLMMKLTDHGCMRLMYKHINGVFPNKKEEVRDFFKDNLLAAQIMDYLINMNNLDKEVKTPLLQGNSYPLIEKYKLLTCFVAEFFEKLNEMKLIGLPG